MSPSIFKGVLGKKPNVYLSKANDRLEYKRTPSNEKSHDFRNTWDNIATEWYDDITLVADWNAKQAISLDISKYKTDILNICMKDGEI